MISLLACALLSRLQDEPPRLRTILPNGAAILVEKAPGAKDLSVDFFISSRGTEETPVTNGLRHLIEHLVARGPNNDIDRKLETAGAFLSAETSRDSMCFKMNLPPGKLDLATSTIGELMQMPAVTPEQIQLEAKILQQEAVLRDDSLAFSVAAWSKAYGEKGLDPMGNLDVIRNATPAMLDKVHKSMFVGSNLAVVIVGDVDLDAATKACAAVLSSAVKLDRPAESRNTAAGGSATTDTAGRAYAVGVRGWKYPETAARLCAAFALANQADDCFVTYTPSSRPGVIILGSQSNKSGLTKAVNEAKAGDLFAEGKMMVKLWLAGQLQTTAQIAEIRGILLVDSTDMRPEILASSIDALTLRDFTDGLQAFRSGGTIVVEGR